MGYREREPRYHQTARELDRLFQDIRIVDRNHTILDYGAGFGFLVRGFRRLGYTNARGFDTSPAANREAVVQLSGSIQSSHCLIALDVFEHMENKEVLDVFRLVNPSVAIVRIPVAEERGGDFHLECSRRDKTHINCKTRGEWIGLIEEEMAGQILQLNLRTIYDSPGVACLLAFGR